jgi:hypothetical protein
MPASSPPDRRQSHPEPGDNPGTATTPTDDTEALRAQVAHLVAILGRVHAWRDRAFEHVDENGLIDQHRLITLGKTLADIPVALRASTLETRTDYDVLVDTEKFGDISTSAGRGQDKALAGVRMIANEGRRPRLMSRTVTTIASVWVPA